MESETPEVDKAAYEATTRTVGKWIVPLAKAQSLERQRNFANSRADQAELRMIRAKRERDKAWAAVDMLVSALTEMRYSHTDKAESMAMAALQSLENVQEHAPALATPHAETGGDK